ncbi:MAG: hypothetical protein EOP48_17370 [Sphingobacteriales bacterium]|nr:MAG: hypothetical protein EOP48_17370 [Sphingobacteriales bacterium]
MSNTKNQSTKKLRIDPWTSESNSLDHRFTIGLIDNNYCPQNVIDKFWDKYIVFGCQHLLLQMSITSNIGIDRSGYFAHNRQELDKFFTDLYGLFDAIYLEHRYNRHNQKIVFVDEGEDDVV